MIFTFVLSPAGIKELLFSFAPSPVSPVRAALLPLAAGMPPAGTGRGLGRGASIGGELERGKYVG